MKNRYPSSNPLHGAWRQIKQRCLNPNCPNYKFYGGRGIKIYESWLDSADEFIEYVETTLGPRPNGYVFDRINNEGNYEPGNLRWANYSQSNFNRRKPNGSPRARSEFAVVRIEKELKQRAVEMAAAEGKTFSAWVRELVVEEACRLGVA